MCNKGICIIVLSASVFLEGFAPENYTQEPLLHPDSGFPPGGRMGHHMHDEDETVIDDMLGHVLGK